MSVDASHAFLQFARPTLYERALQTDSQRNAIEHCSIYLIASRSRLTLQHAAAEITKPAQQPVIKMAYSNRLAGKKVAIFIDYQFEDLEVTFPMLRSVHKSSASPPPLQLTG